MFNEDLEYLHISVCLEVWQNEPQILTVEKNTHQIECENESSR